MKEGITVVPIEEIVSAYKDTGSVWKSAKRLGLCGQSVHERLKSIGWKMQSQKWTREELDELSELAKNLTIGEISRRLGRPYYGVAIKLSRLGIPLSSKKVPTLKIPRGSGFDRANVKKLLTDLERSSVTIYRFCRAQGIALDLFVRALQQYFPERWEQYTATHSTLSQIACAYCDRQFIPMTKKQKTCSRKCQGDRRRDLAYFGGNRRNTIGLNEGVCQLCQRRDVKGLSSHHVLGKENDQENTFLVALCPGCHQLVGTLAARKFTDSEIGWENLITLCMARRMAERDGNDVGVHACVDMEWLTDEDIEDGYV